jgi:hypothetical protein
MRRKRKEQEVHRAMQAALSRRSSQDLTPPDPSTEGASGRPGHAAHPSDTTMVSLGSEGFNYDQDSSLYGALFNPPYRALRTSSPPSPGAPFTSAPPSPGISRSPSAVTLGRRHGHAAQSSDQWLMSGPEQFELRDFSRIASSSSHALPSISSSTMRRVPVGPRPRSASSVLHPYDYSP